MKYFLSLLSAALLLAACSQHVQTTSGKSYLEAYEVPNKGSIKNTEGKTIEDAIREAASVEPTLRFPARIGLARIDNRDLTNIPGIEMEAWIEAAGSMGDGFGELIPVNPMIAEMVSASFITAENKKGITNVINRIRLAAARQHLDAVIIYEVYSKTERHANVLSVADITLIGGYILPSKSINAVGFANGILIDVIQGYPYGTFDVLVEENDYFVTSKNKHLDQERLAETVKNRAAIKLTGEVKEVFQTLKTEFSHMDAKPH